MYFTYMERSSLQLKSLLTTFTDKGKIPALEFLSAAIESAEYERALARGLVSVNFIENFAKLLLTALFLLGHARMPCGAML